MAHIEPFKGLRFNPERGPDVSAVIAPPYDVISPSQRVGYHGRDPHNIVRLILPEASLDADGYTTAARCLGAWRERNVLVEDPVPALYTLDTQFVHDGASYCRRSFFAAVRIETPGEGTIFPHEETLPGPKADRLALLKATATNLSPIFALYPDDGSFLAALGDARSEVLCTATDDDGVGSTLRAITNPAAIRTLTTAFDARSLLIADGHHRYETALRYRDTENPGPAAEYVMMACTSYLDPGLLVLPTHRMIKLKAPLDLDGLLKKASDCFDVTRLPAEALLDAMARVEHHAFGLYAGPGDAVLLKLKDPSIADRNPAPRSDEWKQLETAAAHWFVLHELMGIDDDDTRGGEHVKYTRDASEAVQLVDEGRFDVSVLLKPTQVDEARRVAELGERMPPKSTYFAPKLPTGLVMRAL